MLLDASLSPSLSSLHGREGGKKREDWEWEFPTRNGNFRRRREGSCRRISFDMIHYSSQVFRRKRREHRREKKNKQDGWINGKKSPENSKRREREREREKEVKGAIWCQRWQHQSWPWISRDKTGSFLLFALPLLIDTPFVFRLVAPKRKPIWTQKESGGTCISSVLLLQLHVHDECRAI